MAQLNFNANDHEPNEPLGPVPNGKYLVAITESENKNAKSGRGQYLALTCTVQEGEYKGRKIYANLNIHHENSEAARIARGDLSSICRAVNVMQPRDSIELHNLPFIVEVECKKYRDDQGNDKMSNQIKGYMSKRHTEPAAQSPQPATAGAGNAPWA